MGPLLPFDDYPIHQAPEPLRRVGSMHPRWTERWYFNLQDPRGRLLGVVGGGFYPLTGLLECYACFLVDGQQHNVRTQVRTSDRLDLGIGTGIEFSVEKPLVAWGIALDRGSIQGKLNFTGRAAPFLFEQFNVAAGRWGEGKTEEIDAVQHFVQPGEIVGSIEVSENRFDASGYRSFRDRTWGIRSGRPKLHNWFVVHLENGSYLTLIHQERSDGTRMASEVALVAPDGTWERAVVDFHELKFDPVTRILREGVVNAHTPVGAAVTLEIENIGEGIRLLGAGYTAEQGTEQPVRAEAGEVWDLNESETARRTGRGTIDSPIRARLQWDADIVAGVGVSESAIGRSHYRYGPGLE